MFKKITLLFTFSLIALGIISCSKGDQNVSPRLVKVFVVGQSNDIKELGANKSKGELSFDASGKVIEVLAKQGSRVVAGQSLARIIPSSMAMSESSSLTSYRAARAELQSAELDYKSYTDLRNKNFISASEYERRISMVEGARAKYEQTLDQLGFVSLRARVSGQLVEFNIVLNQLVNSGEVVGFIKADDVAVINLSPIQKPATIRIPTTAIQSDGASVFKVQLDSGSKDIGVLALKQVQIQNADETWAQVSNGLEQGDLIIATGWHVLTAGQKVRIALIDKANQ